MAQAGIHALVGAAIRKTAPHQEWLVLGIILGNLFPDMDNYTVAVATLTGGDTHGLHRTFTHSIFTILAAAALFYAIALVRKQPKWTRLGIGLGIGVFMHIALDLLIWFNGVELLWPLGGWVNFWEGVEPPAWFNKLNDPAEFLFMALFLLWLAQAARAQQTDTRFLGKLRGWTTAIFTLWVVFTALAFSMSKGFFTIFGASYLAALTVVFFITIRMRETVEAGV